MPALHNIHLNVDEDISKKIADKKYADHNIFPSSKGV